jgi:hypothetical protein
MSIGPRAHGMIFLPISPDCYSIVNANRHVFDRTPFRS